MPPRRPQAPAGCNQPLQPDAPAAIGHDLRQSLQAATVQAHALALQAQQQGLADWVGLGQGMAQSLQHCGHLLEAVLAALPDSGHTPRHAPAQLAPDWQAIDLAGLLAAAQQAWQPVATQRGLWLRLQAPPDAGSTVQVVGDPLWLRRVLDNLLANALAHTAQGGVTLAWQAAGQAPGSGPVLSIVDTGPGLQPAAAPAPAGHGLGLLIVRRLCQQLGIALQLHNPPEGGTVARLAWPGASAPTSGAAAAAPSGSGRPGA